MTITQELLRLTRHVHDAWACSDVATLRDLLADEYLHVDVYGRVFDRESWLAYAAEPRSVVFGVSDEHVTVMSGAAVVTSTLSLSGIADASLVRLLQVWIRTPGGWKRRWYQATSVTRARPNEETSR